MISRIWVVALAAALLIPCSQASASFVIDDFVEPGSGTTEIGGVNPAVVTIADIGNGVSRTVEIGGFGTATIEAGVFDAVLSGSGSFLDIDYDLTVSTITRSLFVNQILRTGFVVTSGANSWNIDIVVTSAGNTDATIDLNAIGMPTGFNMTGLVSTPGVGNGHLAALDSIDTLSIRFTKATSGTTFFNSSTGVLAVPEPGSVALLALSSVGGLGLVLRRRRQKS